MIFAALHEAAMRGELLLLDGGLCRWHLRRDGVLVIREIISLKKGTGQAMLAILRQIPGAVSLLARCPATLPEANAWWGKRGFQLRQEGTVQTWVLPL